MPLQVGRLRVGEPAPAGGNWQPDSEPAVRVWPATRFKSPSKMLRRVQNEKFTFEFDSEIALVDCTLGTLGPTVELDDEKA